MPPPRASGCAARDGHRSRRSARAARAASRGRPARRRGAGIRSWVQHDHNWPRVKWPIVGQWPHDDLHLRSPARRAGRSARRHGPGVRRDRRPSATPGGRRPGARRSTPAERARAGCVPGRQPDHHEPGLRRPARRRHAGVAPRVRQRRARAAGRLEREQPHRHAGRRRHHRPHLLRPHRPSGHGSGLRASGRAPARPARHHRVPPGRSAGAAGADRPALHRSWPADRSRPDHRHQWGDGRHLAARPHPAHPR